MAVGPLQTPLSEAQRAQPVPCGCHCSAGCGRTGVICAIDYTQKLLKDGVSANPHCLPWHLPPSVAPQPSLCLSPPLTALRGILGGWELPMASLESSSADSPLPVCATPLSPGTGSIISGAESPLHCSLWPGLQLTAHSPVLTVTLQYIFTVYVCLSTLTHQIFSVSKPPCFTLTLQ